MFSITDQQGTADENTRRDHLTPTRMARLKKTGIKRGWRGCGETGTLTLLVGMGNLRHCGEQPGQSSKGSIQGRHDPVGTYTQEE